MILRIYRDDDLDGVVELWYRTWHHTFPSLRHPELLEEWRTRFRDDIARNESIRVAEEDGRLAGFLVLREQDGYVDQIFVDPEFQHQGIGTALINKAKQLSPGGLSLDTLQQNSGARVFYEQHGFKVAGMGRNVRNGQPNVKYCWKPVP